MINFWYQLDWKIQYTITIIMMIVILQFSTVAFYTNTNRKKFIKSEENKQEEDNIKYRLNKKNGQNKKLIKKEKTTKINNVKKSIQMRNNALKELYLDENDISTNEIETKEGFQNRANIVNHNLEMLYQLENESNNSEKIKKIQKYNFKINFLKSTNAFQLFENNQYIDRMNSNNLKARNFNNKSELTKKYMQSLLPVTKKEKKKTYKLVNNMLARLENSESKTILPKFLRETLLNSNIAKSANWLEGGMPHTHDKTVILPESWFNEVSSYFKDLDNKIVFNGSTLMHELIHIHQRIKPDLYKNIYREWGFIKVDFMDNMDTVLQLNRNNPDGMEDKWIWVDRSYKGELKYYWIGALFNKANPVINQVNYYAYQVNKVENTQENDIKIVRLSSNPPILLSEFSSFNNYFGITNNHYHPNEIAAQYIEELYGESLTNDEHMSHPAYRLFKIKWSLHN